MAWWPIALNDLRLVFRERQAIFWIFVAPLVFTTFFGIILKPQPPRLLRVTLVNHDATDEVVTSLEAALSHERVIVTRADRVEPGKLAAEVPDGAAAALRAGQTFEITLHAGEEETSAERGVRFKLYKAMAALALRGTSTPILTEPVQGPITVEPEELGVRRRQVTSGFQRSVPAYLVMFVFLNLLVSGASLAQDRASGRLRRLFVAPISKSQILAGKLLSRVAIGWVQIAFMLLVGTAIFRIRWADHTFAFLAFLSVYALASAALGVLLGTLFRDPDKCVAAAVWTAILLAPLGGLWWPLEIVGPTLRTVAYVVPTGWAMEGVNAMLAFGAGPRDVAPFAAALLAMSGVSLALAARRLRP